MNEPYLNEAYYINEAYYLNEAYPLLKHVKLVVSDKKIYFSTNSSKK